LRAAPGALIDFADMERGGGERGVVIEWIKFT
jgi:hypothetical protein